MDDDIDIFHNDNVGESTTNNTYNDVFGGYGRNTNNTSNSTSGGTSDNRSDEQKLIDEHLFNTPFYIACLMCGVVLPALIMPMIWMGGLIPSFTVISAAIFLDVQVALFIKRCAYAHEFKYYIFSKKRYKFENLSFVLTLLAALVVAVADYTVSLQGLYISNPNWLVFKFLIQIYAIVVAWSFGTSYIKINGIYKYEKFERDRQYRQLKSQGLDTSHIVRIGMGGVWKYQWKSSTPGFFNAVSNLFGTAASVVTVILFLFLLKEPQGDEIMSLAFWGFLIIVFAFVFFISNRISIIRLNSRKKVYSYKRFFLESIALTICLILALIVIVLGMANKDSKYYVLDQTWFLICRIILAVMLLGVAGLFVDSCLKLRAKYGEIAGHG